MQVTTTLYRRAAKVAGANQESITVNPIAHAMFDIAKDSLRMKARVTPATLSALLEVR